MLRLFQAGVSIADLREMTVGMAVDMLTERSNDVSQAEEEQETGSEASQDDFDKFAERGW